MKKKKLSRQVFELLYRIELINLGYPILHVFKVICLEQISIVVCVNGKCVFSLFLHMIKTQFNMKKTTIIVGFKITYLQHVFQIRLVVDSSRWKVKDANFFDFSLILVDDDEWSVDSSDALEKKIMLKIY